jgi:hypothetical protein
MANTAAPFGLRPVRYLNGSQWTGQARHYYIPSGDGTAYFIGDPVDIVGDSNDAEVNVIGGSFPQATLSEIGLATLADGNYCIGCIVGFAATNRDSPIYGAASTERVALVADDPNLIFEIQDDGATALTADSVGLNAIMQSGSGSTVTGLSGYVLDTNGTAPSADASNMLLIQGLSKRLGNSLAVSAIWDVQISMHRFARLNGLLGIA